VPCPRACLEPFRASATYSSESACFSELDFCRRAKAQVSAFNPFPEPQTFAAAAPICGGVRGGKTDEVAEKIKGLPIRVFHGEEDKAVNIKMSEDMVAASKKAGAREVEFARFPKTGHDSWTVT
jgi:predicted peptidase